MTDTVTIRNGATRLDIRLEKIHEWLMPQWKAAMKLLSKGGWLNEEAVETLAHWFPDAVKDAGDELREAKKAYDTSYVAIKDCPKERRDSQKYLNMALYTSVRDARNKEDKLKKRYLEFLAAKADLKKEN